MRHNEKVQNRYNSKFQKEEREERTGAISKGILAMDFYLILTETSNFFISINRLSTNKNKS